MITLRMPRDKVNVRVNNKLYSVNISDFRILEEIENLPSFRNGYIASLDEHDELVGVYTGFIKRILHADISVSGENRYFKSRALLIKLYNIILSEQEKHLTLNYKIVEDRKKSLQDLLDISRKLSEIASLREALRNDMNV